MENSTILFLTFFEPFPYSNIQYWNLYTDHTVEQLNRNIFRLHKTVCENRTLATIATHDLAKVEGSLVYTSKPPQELTIVPLSSPHPTPADKLVSQLKNEAEALRKEKKRSSVTGLHQYLHLLDTWTTFPCLMDGENTISFPPVTNSSITRISEHTK